MTDLKYLTTGEVARLFRVSDATIKRWEDGGLLKSERTGGGHRRFRAEEVARFQREHGLKPKYSLGLESIVRAKTMRRKNGHDSHSSLFHLLVAGNEEEAANLIIGAQLNGNPLTDVFDDLISSAMQRIGELWHKGDLTVAQEHLATRMVYNAIYKLRYIISVPATKDELAMICGIEGDLHELPTHLAQITLENEGWKVMNFGANTPIYSLAEEVVRHSPAAVCISATILTDIERLARDYCNLREQTVKLKIPVILGGRAFDDDCVRNRFPAELYAATFAEAADFVRKLPVR